MRSLSPAPTRTAPVFQLLLARYVAGQIAEAQWATISAALDATSADADERRAFAAFCLDAAAAGDNVKLPMPEEIEDLLALT